MKWKTILLFIGVVIYMSSLVESFNFHYNLNISQIPVNFSDFIVINTDSNASLTFTHLNFTSSISFVQLNETTNIFNLSFNVSIPNLNVGNYTTNFTILKQVNSTETFTNITFLIQIINTSQINTSLFEIGFNEYSSSVCDTSLPFESSLTTSISLSVDINPFCDEFLLCPAIIFPSEKSVKINISIPKGTIPLKYKKIANFGSNIGNVTFHLEVKDCFFDLSQFCKNVSTVEQLIECQAALLENLRKINKTLIQNQTIVEYVNNTKTIYEQILPLENDTAQLLREFSSSWRTIQSEKQRLEKENKDITDNYASNVKSLQQDISKLSNEMDIRVKQTFLDLYLENQNLTLKNQYVEEKSWSKNNVLLSIFSIFLIVGIFFGYKYIKKELVW